MGKMSDIHLQIQEAEDLKARFGYKPEQSIFDSCARCGATEINFVEDPHGNMDTVCGQCGLLWTPAVKGKGRKFDKGKLRYDLIPAECLEALAEIYSYGAGIHGDNNWQGLPNMEHRYYAALVRHLVAWRKGEKLDAESKKLHTAHLAWNAFALLWSDLQKKDEDQCPSL